MTRTVTMLVALNALCLSCSLAQETPSSALVTATGRSLSKALDSVLSGQGREISGARTLVILVDPSTSLAEAAFVEELRKALSRNAERLTATRIGVAGVDARGGISLQPCDDHAAVVREVSRLMAKPTDKIRNVYKDVRNVAAALGSKSGQRELVLVTFDNGDAEDGLENTVNALRKHDIRLLCITREAYLCDSYWAARPYERAPTRCKLTGGDGAFLELPWGWLMQRTIANEVAPSGTASYPLSRLAAATGGRVHLYSSSAGGHQCAVYDTCLFCSSDHSPAGEIYWKARLLHHAPSTASRRDVYQAAASDPAFRALLKAWRAAYRAGLVRGSPSVKLSGNGLVPQRPRPGRIPNIFGSAGFARQGARAMKLAAECDQIRGSLEKALATQERSRTIPRYRAMAAYTAVMLQLTKVNLVGFEGWCREIAPSAISSTASAFELPEVDRMDRTRRPVGVWFSNFCLCHGVKPFYKVELPGGKPFRKELETLDAMVASFEKRFGHTPIAAALHRCGIAHFWFTYPGVVRPRPRERPDSLQDKGATTPRGRAARPERTSGGRTGGTTGK